MVSCPFPSASAHHSSLSLSRNHRTLFSGLFDEPDGANSPVKVLYCGLCASDVACLSGAAGPLNKSVCGHEIIGEVTRVGPEVKNLKVGDPVGIGGQCDCCAQPDCAFCQRGDEHQCPGLVFTIGMMAGTFGHGAAKGHQATGGFAKHWRGNERFAIKIPPGVDLASAGPLFCAGTTVFTPLRRLGAGKERKRVGVVGLGGLGHLAIQLASALGAEVTAISRGRGKEDDARKLGAKSYIATGANLADDFRDHQGTLDLIISTINPPEFDVNAYLSLLCAGGILVPVGIPQKPLQIDPIQLIMGQKGVVGSALGAPQDIRALLDLVAEKGVRPWVQKWNFDDINEAIEEFNKGTPRYRFVLVNTDNGGKLE